MEIASFVTNFKNTPETIQEQVLKYFEFLMTKHNKKEKKKRVFKFDWEDGLSEYKNKYTSIELQHQANELR